MDSLSDVIEKTPVRVHPQRYAYLRVKELPHLGEHLMVFSSGDDRTVVTSEEHLGSLAFTGVEKWYRLLEFQIPTPFEAPGFLARIATAVAARGLNILIISTFPRDYALVKEAELTMAKDALQALGFQLE